MGRKPEENKAITIKGYTQWKIEGYSKRMEGAQTR